MIRYFVPVGERSKKRQVQKFDSNGNLTTKWGREDKGDGELLRLEASLLVRE